ncbi:MAG: aminomethyltransferase family protein [Desulfobacterales bacterium]|nr:aminomethyltransferase family protein [Desulfobacterales bacterium]
MEAKHTPLHNWHMASSAKMAIFGGYHMPVWYEAGAKQEHLAVLTAAGLFDTSHMALVTTSGPGARDLLQRCFTNDMSRCMGAGKKPLKTGRCIYGAFLDEAGHVMDDAIVFYLAEQRYLIVVNAGMGGAIAGHLTHCARDFPTVHMEDLTDRVAKIDLQGPASAEILIDLLDDGQRVLTDMPYFSFKGHFDPAAQGGNAVRLAGGIPILLSRTGYTGEFGFEIFIAPDQARRLWAALLSEGQARGLLPCGLAARDSLRTGAVLPLSHQDIGPWPFVHHPWPFALPYDDAGIGFTKDFIGSAALLKADATRHTLPFAGYDLRKITADNNAQVLDGEGKSIGTVLTCATDMGIDRIDGRIVSITSPDRPDGFTPRGLCCGFLFADTHLPPQSEVWLKDHRRTVKVEIVKDIRPNRTARRPIHTML